MVPLEKTALVVDDVKSNRKLIHAILQKDFSRILEAENGQQALDILDQEKNIHIVILDLIMPQMDGLEFMLRFNKRHLDIPILICSGNENISLAVDAMKLGARDYVEKPFENQVFLKRVDTIVSQYLLKNQNLHLQKILKEHKEPYYLLGNSAPMQKALLMVEKLASAASTVLITGESGAGKEMAARALHYKGNRSKEPFIVVDCTAINSAMIENELFGYEKGTFSGAGEGNAGLLAAAGNGTLFFDEIGELPLEMQSKFLRVLQEKQIRSVGSSTYRTLNARILAATNRDLSEEVKQGRFREDLYYRLNIVNLTLPPLKERKDDIPILVEHFLNLYSDGVHNFAVGMETLKKLKQYDWPGNVRELENAVQRAVALSEEEEISIELLLPPEKISTLQNSSEEDQEILNLAHYEKIAIEKALRYTQGNRRLAAELIGIGEATLYRKIKEYQIVV